MQTQETNTNSTYYEHKDSQSWKSTMTRLLLLAAGIKSGKNIKKRLTTGEPGNNDVPEPPKNLQKKLNVKSWEVDGRNVFRLTPKQNATGKVILYIHGGAYVNNTSKYHWNFVDELIAKTGYTVILPDYPLAPNNSFAECFQYMEKVYDDLISHTNPSDVVIMGDSSGGGCSLALAQKLKEKGVAQPSQIILICPWLDVALDNPDIAEKEKNDPFSGVEGLRLAGESYARGTDLDNYLVSPVNGDVEGLGKISIFAAGDDILEPDARLLKKICEDKGVSINYYYYPKMIHVWPILGFAESDVAIDQIVELLSEKK